MSCASVLAVDPDWEIVESGPADGEQTVLLHMEGLAPAASRTLHAPGTRRRLELGLDTSAEGGHDHVRLLADALR